MPAYIDLDQRRSLPGFRPRRWQVPASYLLAKGAVRADAPGNRAEDLTLTARAEFIFRAKAKGR